MPLATIDDLLAPLSWPELLREHYGRRHLRIPGTPAKVDGFPSWPELNRALASHRIFPQRLLVARDGRTVPVISARRDRRGDLIPRLDIDALHRHLRDGHTLVLYAVDEMFPAVGRLAGALERLFGRGAQANIFASRDRAGNRIHYDAHEVFVVQVSGHKRWRLFGPPADLPLEADRGPRADAAPPTDVVDELILGPGDVLYVPRGHWHDVTGVGEPTLHVSFGIENPTGFDLLDWLRRELAGCNAIAAELPRFGDADAARGHMDELRELLLARLTDDVLDRFFASADAAIEPRPEVRLPDAFESADLGRPR